MQDIDILNLWKSYDKKLEESLQLHKQNAEEITRLKVQSFLASMKPIKIFTVILGVLWVALLDLLIAGSWSVANPFFLGSAIALTLLNKLAIGIYLYQLILIYATDINAPVLATQSRLAGLKSSTLWVTRLLFLQLPLWTTFYWNKTMLENGNAVLYILQAIVTLSFTFIAFWLFFNIRYGNRNKKWFRFIFKGREWTPVIKSMELLEEIKEYNRTS